MEFVVDANIVISALIASEGKTRDLIFSNDLRLIAPDFLVDEVQKYKKEICRKAGFLERRFDIALNLILSKITLYDFNSFKKFIAKAKTDCPDEHDVFYLALALKQRCFLWSNDKVLKSQKLIVVVSTKDLLGMI